MQANIVENEFGVSESAIRSGKIVPAADRALKMTSAVYVQRSGNGELILKLIVERSSTKCGTQ